MLTFIRVQNMHLLFAFENGNKKRQAILLTNKNKIISRLFNLLTFYFLHLQKNCIIETRIRRKYLICFSQLKSVKCKVSVFKFLICKLNFSENFISIHF